jgi:molybdate transport system substrate-binding protein
MRSGDRKDGSQMNQAERRCGAHVSWTPIKLASLLSACWFVALSLAGFNAVARAGDLIVAGASDLSPLTAALEPGFEKASHNKVRFTLASSGSLAQQIENGAPFDVFLSADERLVKQLVASGHLEPDILTYATGRLGLWSKDGRVRSLEDLKKPQVLHLAIANPEHAPYGVAARKALETQGLWQEIQPKIVYGENVRQAMQFAESGNADAVITSWTLLIGRGVLLPAEWHDPIRQAGGVVKGRDQTAVARQFLKFLTSAEGRKILQSGGLFPP